MGNVCDCSTDPQGFYAHQFPCKYAEEAKEGTCFHLIAVYPQAVGKPELAEAVGQSPTSGGYFNNLGRLRSLGLVDYPAPGQVVARPVLFLER